MAARHLSYRLLGPLEVYDGDRPLQLGGTKQRALLAMLLLNANRVVSSDRLIDALWGEKPPETAQTALQVHVSHLRKLLEPDQGRRGHEVLVTQAPGYVLRTGEEQLDTVGFDRLLESGRDALAGGRAELATRTLAEALSLWRGPPLAEFSYEAFAQVEIDRLGALHLEALEERIEADLALARHAEVVGELEALVVEHPLRERLRRQLMLALYRSGRQAEALGAYQDARRVLVDELGIDPSTELQALEKAILNQDPTLAVEAGAPAVRTNLPVPPTPLVGREAELAALRERFGSPDVRLVTLTGPGGTGKTRLALELARSLLGRYEDGVFLVELAPIDDPLIALGAIAQALGVKEGAAGSLLDNLAGHLHDKHVLLVLDNFEQVLAAGPDVSSLLSSCPRLEVLATSRAALRISGEHEQAVPPLGPDEAFELFAARARAVKPGLELTPEARTAAREICRRVDGLPLAIELAAARVKLFSPSALLPRLTNRLSLLTGGASDLPARQQTLRSTISWSYELLDGVEQQLFARLAVFAGGWTLDGAEAVCADEGVDVLEGLASLLDKSLVRRDEQFEAEARFSMLETIREFGLECLEERGEAGLVRRWHADWYLALAEEAEPQLRTGQQAVWLDRLEREHDNIRAALGAARESGRGAVQLRLACALWRFWLLHSNLSEGRRWLDEALAAEEQPAALRARALTALGAVARIQGDYNTARTALAESLQLYRDLGDEEGVARSLDKLGNLASCEGDYELAAGFFDESIGMCRALDDRWDLASALVNRGDLALHQREYERATALFEESLSLFRAAGDAPGSAVSLLNLGLTFVRQGRNEQALPLLQETLAIFRDLSYREGIANCLEPLAAVVVAEGGAERAARLLAGSRALCETIGAVLDPLERELHERTTAAVTERLDPDVLAAVSADGRAMSLADLVAYALEGAPATVNR
jgi:predicted ATPase/DNA-binding SARP family transcriptional activator